MKKIISVILALTIVASFCINVTASTNTKEGVVHIQDRTTAHNAITITPGMVVAQYLYVDKPFVAIEVCCPNHGDNIGNLTLTLYRWAGDHDTTLKGAPIAKKEWVNFNDNQWIGVYAEEGKAFGAGKYMWTLTEPVQNCGVWKAQLDNFEIDIIQTSYIDGKEVQGCFESSVFYAVKGEIVEGGNDVPQETVKPSEPAESVKGTPQDTDNIIMFVDNITAYVNGVETKLDVAPVVLNGRTFLPARFVAEKLGCVVSWDEATQTVLIEKDDIVITLVIGEAAIKVSGEYQVTDAASFVTEGRTMVPIRAITEALGMQINYFDPGLIVIGPEAEKFESEKAKAFIELY